MASWPVVLNQTGSSSLARLYAAISASNSPEAASAEPEALAFKRERLQHLRALSQLGEGLLRALVSGQAIDPTPFLSMRDKAS